MMRKFGLMVTTVALLFAAGSQADAQQPLIPLQKLAPIVPASPFKPAGPRIDDPFDFSKPIWTPPGKPLPSIDMFKTVGPVGFDKRKYPEERAALVSKKSDFPKLGEDFEVLGPSTGHADKVGKYGTYNCIAWSLGITGNWEWPGKSMKEFDKLYYKHGFKRLKIRNTEVKPGTEKAMVYGKVTSEGVIEVTHAARQEADGNWTSKIGGMALIKHRTPDDVAGPSYGDPLVIYVRQK